MRFETTNSLSLAVDIVTDADKYLDISRPMPSVYYLFFAGRYMENVGYKEVLAISKKEWQEAKSIVYSDRFEMGTK